jgi:hypothetical protein
MKRLLLLVVTVGCLTLTTTSRAQDQSEGGAATFTPHAAVLVIPPVQLKNRNNIIGGFPPNGKFITLYPPPKDGLFRLTVLIITTSGATNGECGLTTCFNWYLNTYWNDEAAYEFMFGEASTLLTAQSQVPINGGVVPVSTTQILHARAGKPIGYSVGVSPVNVNPTLPDGSTYSLYITLEKVQ